MKKFNDKNLGNFDLDFYDEDYEVDCNESKVKFAKCSDQEDNGKKPQWRADRKKAKKLKNQRLGITN
jgi:hypothetical protein